MKARINVVISGGTGAGKTTLLNVLSGYISEKERIVTIEDSAELQLKQRHCVRLETRPANIEGSGAVMQRQLVINSLRMRPDRIVVGEVRGEEALDMLQAMNTGHDGSMTTVHANSPRDAIARIETMALMANLNLPEKAVRRQIASAVQLIVQIARFTDGSRRVTHVTRNQRHGRRVVSLQDVFVFEKQGISPDGRVLGTFTATGVRPNFAERLNASGINVLASWFEHSHSVIKETGNASVFVFRDAVGRDLRGHLLPGASHKNGGGSASGIWRHQGRDEREEADNDSQRRRL